MKVEIDYNGALFTCLVDGKNFFTECDSMERAYALSAMRAVQEAFKREVRLGKIKGIDGD